MAIISKTGKKTDKVDAEKIAQVLRMNMIPECHVPSAPARIARGMIRQRIRLVQDRTRTVNRIHNLLDKYGAKLKASQAYSAKVIREMHLMNLGIDTGVVRRYVRQIEHLNEMISDMNEAIALMASGNRDAELLASMTGIGPATVLLLEVLAAG